MYEILPIPSEKALAKEPIHLSADNLEAWPGQSFRITLAWNAALKRFIFEFRSTELGTLIEKTPAQLARGHTYRDALYVTFFDTSETQTKVTPANLGDQVKLVAAPLPDAPEFDTYVERMNATS